MGSPEGLRAALAGEHAAIWAYGPIGARLGSKNAAEGRAAELAHRNRRDALLLRLAGESPSPPAAEPGYQLPFPVTNTATALRLAIQVEDRTSALWRAALADTAGADRKLALDALIDCAVRATRFRRYAGVKPAIVPFPGRAAG